MVKFNSSLIIGRFQYSPSEFVVQPIEESIFLRKLGISSLVQYNRLFPPILELLFILIEIL